MTGLASQVKGLVKAAALSIMPDLTLQLLSARSRRLIELQCKELGLDELARSVSRQVGAQVATGPFKGMKLDYEALPVHSSPKLLGTYEKEIVRFIEDAISSDPSVVLNVGTSDGYYAVGLALRLPMATIYAAEADPKSIAATERNATLNGATDRVVSIGIIHPSEFSKYLKPSRSLIIMDCEGAEFQLLSPHRDPVLRFTSMIVEVHPEAGEVSALTARFSLTHSIKHIESMPRGASDVPVELSNVDPLVAVDERRGPQSWLYFKPNDVRP